MYHIGFHRLLEIFLQFEEAAWEFPSTIEPCGGFQLVMEVPKNLLDGF